MATNTASSLGSQPHYRRGGPFVLANLSIGHGFTHWYGQSIVVLLPVIQAAMGFTVFQFGFLNAILIISGGIANIPAGFVADIFRRRWGLMLTLCMAVAAISYGLVAASPGFVILALVFFLLPLPGTVWHMPAIAAISQRFPTRRGFSLSMHGVGGQVGDSIGPLIVGALLTLFAGAWRPVALIYVFPALVMTAVVFWALVSPGRRGRRRGPAYRGGAAVPGRRPAAAEPVHPGPGAGEQLPGHGFVDSDFLAAQVSARPHSGRRPGLYRLPWWGCT